MSYANANEGTVRSSGVFERRHYTRWQASGINVPCIIFQSDSTEVMHFNTVEEANEYFDLLVAGEARWVAS